MRGGHREANTKAASARQRPETTSLGGQLDQFRSAPTGRASNVKENSTIFALMGALTILLVVLVVVLGLRSKHTGLDGYLLYATFEQADGLSAGSPVYLSCVKVGVVEQIILNP